jgi:hypothetical protein
MHLAGLDVAKACHRMLPGHGLGCLARRCCLGWAHAAGRLAVAMAGWPQLPWLAGRGHGWLERAVAAMYS